MSEQRLAYMPAKLISKIQSGSKLISIQGKYDNPIVPPDGVDVHILTLDLNPTDEQLSDETLKALIDFCFTEKGLVPNLHVHCTEGMYRSPTVAEVLCSCSYHLNDDSAFVFPGRFDESTQDAGVVVPELAYALYHKLMKLLTPTKTEE